MKEKTSDAIRAALFEATFVVLGVVLALAANEWRQARANRQEAHAAVAAILEELRSNRDAVADARDYHGGLLEMLRAEREEGWVPGVRQFPRGFVSAARLYDTAWASASATGALAKVEYAVVVRLSGVYAQQLRYEQQARSVGQLVYEELFRGGAESIAANYRNLASVISTFVYREQQLVELYEETLGAMSAGG